MADARVFRFHDSGQVFFGAVYDDTDELASAHHDESVRNLDTSAPRVLPKPTPGFAPACPQVGTERRLEHIAIHAAAQAEEKKRQHKQNDTSST
ncbi:hypothetical protein HBH56_041070 [Parastagonospora nodorum]|uniref:Uncharacterized protein n=2 Tax=Phaeosphaeria nodorum (strain SN15 / ATCC MYA-4574 / FGSC 10173) TaxID=321614 RepID=A0A7U2EUE7_PHANO|nr:hypothetical protein SNOG_07918 [Parastagonospora nodorum SN15]KAH3917490.1 hypothetical protein HBH56_041070 [Parastagonospora nodorum]EAT84194.1 hypothetical protein SNOG_07918 [Parastagonospora nodorum SN15]KAH3933363.1 hypothetical protein HBH54_068820 [Parastagonospora nodorum]KAH3943439.1 hypothetical protein HBH53_172990 [Parastagonospora nodorum]KAH3961743.1 hypothetical protein HBH52_228170 [Parastagonospora nodorum]